MTTGQGLLSIGVLQHGEKSLDSGEPLVVLLLSIAPTFQFGPDFRLTTGVVLEWQTPCCHCVNFVKEPLQFRVKVLVDERKADRAHGLLRLKGNPLRNKPTDLR